MCHVTWGGEAKVTGGVTVAKELTLSWEGHPGLPVWAQCNARGPSGRKREAGEAEAGRELKMLHFWL